MTRSASRAATCPESPSPLPQCLWPGSPQELCQEERPGAAACALERRSPAPAQGCLDAESSVALLGPKRSNRGQEESPTLLPPFWLLPPKPLRKLKPHGLWARSFQARQVPVPNLCLLRSPPPKHNARNHPWGGRWDKRRAGMAGFGPSPPSSFLNRLPNSGSERLCAFLPASPPLPRSQYKRLLLPTHSLPPSLPRSGSRAMPESSRHKLCSELPTGLVRQMEETHSKGCSEGAGGDLASKLWFKGTGRPTHSLPHPGRHASPSAPPGRTQSSWEALAETYAQGTKGGGKGGAHGGIGVLFRPTASPSKGRLEPTAAAPRPFSTTARKWDQA